MSRVMQTGKAHFDAGTTGSSARTTCKRDSTLRVPDPPDDGRLTKAQIETIRAMEPQDITPTRAFLDLLKK